MRPICCLAAPRAREARRRGSVRDGARDVKTVKPAVAAASCAVVALPRCSGDEGVSSGARERRAPDPREARGVGGTAAPQPAVARPQELGASAGRTLRRRVVDVGSGTCAWRCRRRRAAPCDRCRADAACEFLARAPIKGAALLWFGDTRLINTPVHAADERRVECSLAHEQSGVGGGAVLELFDG